MIKTFYKKTPPKKIFFDPNMQVRSLAYGETVLREMLEWENYFLDRKRAYKDEFVLFAQKDIFGCDFSQRDQALRIDEEVSILPSLHYDGLRLDVTKNGYVCVNGQKSTLNLGTELKAWAVFSIPTKTGTESALMVIGRPFNGENGQLSVYELTKHGVGNKMRCFAPLEYSPEATSTLLTFGKHIFVVHNSKLQYYHFLPEENELEVVAIGQDGDNADAPWCQYVGSKIVLNGKGGVFWQSDKDVYGFTIGYPRRLVKFTCKDRETIVHLRSGTKSVYVYTKDKNIGTYACVRYRQAENGQYEGRVVPVENKPSSNARVR